MPPPSHPIELIGSLPEGAPADAIHTASVAPPAGDPSGARTDTFVVVPRRVSAMEEAAVSVFGDVRDRVLANPFTCLLGAFALGYLAGRSSR